MARAAKAAGAAALCVAALTVSACSWRFETEPEPFRTPSPITVLRDHVAAAEAAVAAAAAPIDSDPAHAEVAAVPVRLEALGGVSPTTSPRPDTDLEAAMQAAREATDACIAGAGVDPLGGLCASIALSHEVIGVVDTDPTWEQFAYVVEPTTIPPSDSDVPADTVARLALEHDRLRALYEVVAARSSGTTRTEARERSSEQRARVTQLLAVDGVDDLTEPAYAIPTDEGAVLTAHVTLAEAYAALLVAAAPQDREWLFNSAVNAYGGALLSGLEVSDVPALPGAVQPTPSPSAS